MPPTIRTHWSITRRAGVFFLRYDGEIIVAADDPMALISIYGLTCGGEG